MLGGSTGADNYGQKLDGTLSATSGVVSSAVDPGWVPTKMGGAGAPGDLEDGHRTQVWLSVSDDARAKVSGQYWYHRQLQPPSAAVGDVGYQDRLIMRLAEITGVSLG